MSNVLYLQCACTAPQVQQRFHTAVTATSDADVELFLNFHMRYKPRLPHLHLLPME